MYETEVYDIIGIGIGPFNLGLAAVCQESTKLNCYFVDKQPEFTWHPGMLLPRARLQVPWYSDLVTLLNPRSQFTYMSYLYEKKKMFAFAIHDHPFLTRIEYNEYCQWVVSQLKNCGFASACRRIEYRKNDDCFRVELGTRLLRGKRIVVGTGTSPSLPSFIKKLDHKMVFHSAKYLFRKPELLKKKRITIIGSGQSAAEIFLDLLNDAPKFKELRWYTRSPRLYPMDYSKFALQLSSPVYIDRFFRLNADKKRQLLSEQDNLYKGINQQLLNDIYDELYMQKVNGLDANIEIATACQLSDMAADKNALHLEIHNHEQQGKFYVETEAVILATGYEYRVPQFIFPIREMIRWNDDGYYDVQRNYSVDFNDRIFVQNADLYSHGFNSADLSLGPYRNAVILNTILGREQFKVENGRSIY